MLDHLDEAFAPEVKCDDSRNGAGRASSFKKIRQARKKNHLKRKPAKAIGVKGKGRIKAVPDQSAIGPTKETLAKLNPDPLVRFKKQNILTDSQIWAFQSIRRAIQIITDGTQVRVSRFNDAVVQTSRFGSPAEVDYEIRIKDHYTDWIDRMTQARLQAGPVLDIIIDEMSLGAVDRKWGKRKGWAKSHLQLSLGLYRAFSPSSDRER